MSNTRNATNAATHQPQPLGSNQQVIQMPIISSHTMPPWSCTPKSRETLSHSQQPNRVPNAITPRKPHAGSSCKKGTNANPTSVPHVPGAGRIAPEPNPNAINCHGSRQMLAGVVSGRLGLFIGSSKMLIAAHSGRDVVAIGVEKLHTLTGHHAPNHPKRMPAGA